MKKVRRKDLEYLIAHYYWEFIDPEHKPINDIIAGHGDVQIDINSVCIFVKDCSSFSNVYDKKAFMQEFANKIEEVTFGNLKVTNMGCEEKDASYYSWLDIANAYEVID